MARLTRSATRVKERMLLTNYDHVQHQKTRRIRRAVYVTPLVLAFTVAVASSAHAEHVIPPQVPADIQVTRDNRAFLEGHAAGTQDYICLPSVSGFAWTFFRATGHLVQPRDEANHHAHSSAPTRSRAASGRATWQDSQDTSVVWAKTAPGLPPTATSSGRVRSRGFGFKWSALRTDRPTAIS